MKVALLISGGGSTAEAVIKAVRSGELKDVEPIAVISHKPGVGGLEKAHKLDVPTHVVDKKVLGAEGFRDQLLKILDTLNPDLVSQNGWLPMTPDPVVHRFVGRIINQHPGKTDPERDGHADFGGKGMHGSAVTCATLAYSWLINEPAPTTEATVHHVAPYDYDHGAIISNVSLDIPPLNWSAYVGDQRLTDNDLAINVLKSVTEEVKKNLLPLEHENVIGVLREIAQGAAKVVQRPQLIPTENLPVLEQAKALARHLYPHG